MKNQNNQRLLILLSATIAIIFLLGASASTFAQKGIGAPYGARDPRTCADKKQPKTGAITPALAAQYVICGSEHQVAEYLYLVEDVKVTQIGAARRYNPNNDANFDDIDPRFPVYSIQGSLTSYQCKPVYQDGSNQNANCSVGDEPKAKGACFKDTFGDWHCGMTDVTVSVLASKTKQPPPGAQAVGNNDDDKTAAPDKQPKTKDNAEKTEKPDGIERDENGMPKPDFAPIEKYAEIVKYEYAPFEDKLYVWLKPKVGYKQRPAYYCLVFRDKDGVKLNRGFYQFTMPYEDGIGETFKTEVNTVNQNQLKQVAAVEFQPLCGN